MPEGIALTDFPAPWRQELDALCDKIELDVAGLTVRVTLTPSELEGAYLPILHLLNEQSRRSPQRVVVGLAGIPGSGKSTFAAILRHLASELIGPDHLAVVALDGWHWNNLIHERKRIRDVDGKMVSLKERKGCPESFNAPAYADCLRRLRDPAASVPIPLYDRRRHEPVSDALTVTPATRIILAEGNYLLSRTPPWDEVFETIAPRFELACDPDVARQRVIARHVQGGSSMQEAQARYDRNDAHNTHLVLPTAANADYRITLTPSASVIRLAR